MSSLLACVHLLVQQVPLFHRTGPSPCCCVGLLQQDIRCLSSLQVLVEFSEVPVSPFCHHLKILLEMACNGMTVPIISVQHITPFIYHPLWTQKAYGLPVIVSGKVLCIMYWASRLFISFSQNTNIPECSCECVYPVTFRHPEARMSSQSQSREK